MGEAMEAADPNIKTTLLKCMRQPATTLSVQLSAIQAFRQMSVTPDVSVAIFVEQFVFIQNQMSVLCMELSYQGNQFHTPISDGKFGSFY